MDDALRPFSRAVLQSLLGLGEEAYGRRVLEEVERRLAKPVSAGSLYSALEELEADGLVTSTLADGTAVRDGRPRRYYRPTGRGCAALERAGF